MPTNFSLSQNYPNLFTTIDFEVPKQAKVTIKIYDILGREVYTLVNKSMMPGSYKEVWDGRNNQFNKVASGIYDKIFKLPSKDFDS